MPCYRLHNRTVWASQNPRHYPCYTHITGIEWDTEEVWESVCYVAEKAYDARDIAGLFFDGMTIEVLNHYNVPLPVIFLVGGAILGIVLIHRKKKTTRKDE